MLKACIVAMACLAVFSFLGVVVALGVEYLYATVMFTLVFWLQCYAGGKMVSEYRERMRDVRN